MNRSVLVVTPFFAPQNHAAVFRAYKLAKYLPDFGWKPIVLTVDTQYEFNEDPALLIGLPKGTEVVRVRYIEPTLRGLRMALGGRDRTFKGLKESTAGGQPPTSPAPKSSAALAYHNFLKNWFHSPDAYWTWAKAATRIANRIIEERNIRLVFTTAPPFSSLLIGESLQRNGASWVADCRDPLAYTNRLSSPVARVYERQRTIVRRTLATADAITFASSSMVSIYRDMFGKVGVDPVFIPTGIDEEVLQSDPSPKSAGQPYLLFAGEVLPEFDAVFWETFAKVANNHAVESTGIRVLIVGTLTLNQPRLARVLDRFGLHGLVEFRDQMPQAEIYALLRKSIAGLLVPGVNSCWWTNFAKMTDCIGMRKPVVAVVPDPSEARTALTRSRLGIFLDGSADKRVQILTDFLLGKYRMSAPDVVECDRYTARYQVQSFAEIFDGLHKPKALSAAAR
jgi:glycosyltransferase involved in cell wall biosynthesis